MNENEKRTIQRYTIFTLLTLYEPASPDRFTQVIVTPWFSDVDQMKYELTNPMRVIGVENRYRPPNVPIEVSFEKVKELRDDYPTLGELRDAIKIRASEKDLEREFREKYTLLQLIARLTGLKQFRSHSEK